MIAIDVTEASKGSRLPTAVVDAAQVVNGLEALTGADLLISPLSKPKLPDRLTEAIPHRKLLAIHTRAGILVQRKDGMDLLSSLSNLCTIEKRMLDWCGPIGPWLLIAGQFAQRKDGRLCLNGFEVITRHSYKAVKAALDWWQLRGGHVTELSGARLITSWVNHWHESMLTQLNTELERVVVNRLPAQALKRPESDWWVPLAIVPTIGEVKAQVLAQWLPESKRTLAQAIVYLCDERNVQQERPPGFGPTAFEHTRRLFGLTKGDIVRIISVGDSQPERYPVTIVWPVGSQPATIDGQWWRNQEGHIVAVYHSQDELRTCLEIIGME